MCAITDSVRADGAAPGGETSGRRVGRPASAGRPATSGWHGSARRARWRYLGDQARRPRHSPRRTDAELTAPGRRAAAGVWVGRQETGASGGRRGAAETPRLSIGIFSAKAGRAPMRHRPRRCDDLRARPRMSCGNSMRKGRIPLAEGGRCHALSLLDDHSRFAVGLAALPTLETPWVQPALISRLRTLRAAGRATKRTMGRRGGTRAMRRA